MNISELVMKDVAVTYSNGHTAIHDVNCQLHGGNICALVGVNGSGKSTMFKSIMGVVRPTMGTILINGESTHKALKANVVAYVPQTEEVDWNFPVLVSDVVMMGRYGRMGFLRIPRTNDKQQVDLALQRVGMFELRDRQIGELSGGQKKRVFLARALAQQGSIILLDEPFTGVDVQTESAIIDLLKSLQAEGHLILVSTHNLGSVPDFCNEVILINRTVLAQGDVVKTFTHANLQKAFGGVLRHINIPASKLHDDEDERSITVITDDERAAVFYGSNGEHNLQKSTE